MYPDSDIYDREHGSWFVAEEPSGPSPLLAEQIRQNMGNINEKLVGVQCMQRRNELIAILSIFRVVAKSARLGLVSLLPRSLQSSTY
jgi:hypothetical protein